MNNYLRISVLASLASVSLVFAETTEFRTPQRLTRGEMHWPLKPVEEAWWYDKADTEEREINHWSIDAWAGYYGISAGQAFFKPNGGITTETASLSALWFGTDSFRGIDVFAAYPGPAALMESNPFLGFATHFTNIYAIVKKAQFLAYALCVPGVVMTCGIRVFAFHCQSRRLI